MRFQYSSGSRPLDGFTLKRGVGKGGFGEVYFAVSDGGKEAALKLLRGEGEIELRGVELCLNLKHPHLVHLYDLRTDADGRRWVIMEYVAGESLSNVLAQHPDGLPHEQARLWFVQLASAVGYLHDHGIVHRDLKPANVFVESDGVKVGDYGLSKNLSGSQRTANTQSVGTVHYMAPEIGSGNYSRQIDVYAAGVILYEMLTGRPPFDGESAGEILMKHLTATPDLSCVPAEWSPIIAKVLAKNPNQRYESMEDLVRAVENASPNSTTATPQPATEREPPRRAGIAQPVWPEAPGGNGAELLPLPSGSLTARSRVIELCNSMALVVLFTGLTLPLWMTLASFEDPHDPTAPLTLSTVFFLTVATCWSIMLPAKMWSENRGDPWTRRLVMLGLGGLIGLASVWLSARWPPDITSESEGFGMVPLSEAGVLTYFAIAFFALRWWRLADRHRPARFSFAPVLAVGFWALVLLPLVRPHPWRGALVLVLTSVIVQLVSPWEEPPPPIEKRLRWRYA